MPFFSDYGFSARSVPFSSQYYSQLLQPYPGSNGRTPRLQPRSYNSMAVEQTLRAIRRAPAAITARHYARPVHINAAEIDVTTPRRKPLPLSDPAVPNDSAGGNIHRGRTVVRLHTINKRTPPDKPPAGPSPAVTNQPPEDQGGMAKKGTIKRHLSVGIKVAVTDDRRPSVTDDMLREQEALFDTMIMEEMEGQKDRRKSYPVDVDGGKKRPKRRSDASAVAAAYLNKRNQPETAITPEVAARKPVNWKLNYDVIVEESSAASKEENGPEQPVSFTFRLNKKKTGGASRKLDANHNVVQAKPQHADGNTKTQSHVIKLNNNTTKVDNAADDGSGSLKTKKKVVKKKKVVVKKKVQKVDGETTASVTRAITQESKKTVITPFVRASFGKTFISPSQVSSTMSKFEKPKPKPAKLEQPPPPPPPPQLQSEDSTDEESSDDESSSDDDDCGSSVSASLCSSDSTYYYDTDEYDSSSSSDTPANSYQTSGNGEGVVGGAERTIRSYNYRHHSRPKRVVPPATSIPRFRKYTVDDFNFLKVLGKGSFGKVLLAELKGTDYYYAVKCLKKDVVLEDDDVECTLIERKVLALGTNHPYLCHLFCTFQTESHLFFVMEYLNGGDLMFHIQQSGRFDEGRARFYASEIVSGLKFLHKKGIVYRDLKLDNILLDFNGHVRIADFGMCKLQIYLDKTADTFCGTPDYMAPEIIKGLKYNQSVDWWSFGILLYEMLVGKSPFSGCDEDALFWSICNEQPQYPRYLSTTAKSVLVALLDKDASKRLGSLESNHSAEDVIRHPFFSSLDWNKLERRELEPPYMPKVYHPLDTHYFDKHFTKEKPRLTPVDKTILESMDQSQFDGFTYTNPNVTDL
ncbi:cAMP-dependent protein kinase catalytic subunit 3 isoform X2 [Adelges cooleyi]|uniref:cAMP-dependent protein kinase catalytic subunit 3 isoform X2 n=1 Tax=Adelges cooleyi TaxID=133065 RepID=UPI0021801DD6|nr:cAMP-dependent protein kinase catalytic subunit 3 isoform X2 [Adelges cooleyi]